MASEIKVDTISEKTSAGGVTIDGLLIKDGNISGDVALAGTTPTFTIGDAGAEDAALVFDGNAQDFYIALDDSADDLVIGLGSTVGTTPAISINSDRDVTISDGAIDFDVASHDTSNGLKLGGTLVTATAAELNIMDGVTSTAAEINLIDGGTARGTTAIADGDGVLINDGGTMRMTTVETLSTYIGAVSTLAGLTDVSMDITNFTDGLLIQTQTDGSAPGTGTLSSATGNIGIGKDVFAALTSGDYNVGIGYGALAAHTTGSTVIAIGKNAMAAATTMGSSLAIGSGALDGSDTENDNLAIGINALGATLSGGEKNIAIGDSVLDAVTSGDNNTAMGRASATAITTGSHNIVVGGDAAAALVDGSYNTFLGSNACNDMTTGDQNVFIGYDCKGESGSTDHDNQIVIGGTNLRGIGDNNFTFGKGSGADRVYNAFTSNASWTRSSDVRYKKNIEDNEDCGLDFINDLRPVTFRWKAKSEIDSNLPDYDKTELKPEYDKKLYGLIAQEVKTSLDKYGITDFGGWKEVNDGIQCISQEMFVHPLIKAVQELSAKVIELEKKLEDK